MTVTLSDTVCGCVQIGRLRARTCTSTATGTASASANTASNSV